MAFEPKLNLPCAFTSDYKVGHLTRHHLDQKVISSGTGHRPLTPRHKCLHMCHKRVKKVDDDNDDDDDEDDDDDDGDDNDDDDVMHAKI
ncbi:hypothetical protein PoB_005711900 [Plakobranchus ocellatus]|uniref:Uncharacterized protein n=1 Tax=Plakobranchus ocellatus TaxID=259542 RepID=A0AAV4CIH0_9GAST|nr:hypothetical protein PoB_005711900 [Plakobranchus ocellatus]